MVISNLTSTLNEEEDNKEKEQTRDENGNIDVTDPENYYYYRFIKNEADKEKCFYSIFEDAFINNPGMSINSAIIATINYIQQEEHKDIYFERLLERIDNEYIILKPYKNSITRNKDYIANYYNTRTDETNYPLHIYFFNKRNNIFNMPLCNKVGKHWNSKILRVFMEKIFIKSTEDILSRNDYPNNNECNLTYCIFEKTANFGKANFEGRVDFSGSIFKAEANFHNVTFQQVANFHNVTFQEGAYFSGSTFQAKAFFDGVTFKQEASFSTVNLEGDVEFFYSKFEAEADFCNVIFHHTASFSEAKFQGNVDFKGSQFKGYAFFHKITFHQKALYMGVQFNEQVDFINSNFEGNAYFDVHIYQPIIIGDSYVKSQQYYEPTIFHKLAKFEAVSFKELVSFYGAEFHENMNFFRTNFKDIANFNNVTFQQAFNFANAYINTIKFLGIKLGKEKSSNLSNFKEYFTKIQNSLGNISMEDFRRTCAIVKDSLDKESQKIDANKFYSLELLAHEKELSPWSKQGFILFLNKWSSNHGQSWLQPLVLIISLGIFAGFLNIFSGELSKFLEILSTLSGLNAIFIALPITIVALILSIYAIKSYVYQWFFITIIVISLFLGLGIKYDGFLQGFQRAILPFYTDKDTTFSLIACFGFCYIEHDSNKSIWIDFIINFIKVINIYLLYQLIQAVRLNTRR